MKVFIKILHLIAVKAMDQ